MYHLSRPHEEWMSDLTPLFPLPRVTHAHRVSEDFHARIQAQSRTYVYRIALGICHQSVLPIQRDLCWNLRNTCVILP